MDLYHLLTILLLAYSCEAGFLIPLIATAAEFIGESTALFGTALTAGETAAESVYAGAIGSAFGFGQSAGWFGMEGMMVVDGVAYMTSNIVGVGTLAGGT